MSGDRPAEHTVARLMLYSHDLAGLGHLRRNLAIAGELRARRTSLLQLLVTGSSVPQVFELPAGAEYLKLPHPRRLVPRGAPASLQALAERLRRLRGDVLLAAAHAFQPHAVLVDHLPGGSAGEMVDALRYLQRAWPATRLLVGLRDFDQDPATMRISWQSGGIYELLDEVYDRILVYGQPDVSDIAEQYALSDVARAKLRYVGYVARRPDPRATARLRAELAPRSRRLVLVTAGGGADESALYELVVECVRREQDAAHLDWLIVGGPLLPSSEAARIQAEVGGRPALRFLPFVDDLADYIGAADVVVARGGYNTTCEILAAARPAVLVPRPPSHPEQLMRVEALSRRGLVRMVRPDELTPRRLLDEIRIVQDRRPPVAALRLDGLANVADELEAALPSDESAQPCSEQ